MKPTDTHWVVNDDMTTPIAAGPLDRRVSHQVTEQMVDAFIAFTDKVTNLHHPDVPYHGTVNGDSEDQWRRRVVKAALSAALMVNALGEGRERGTGWADRNYEERNLT